MAGTLYTYPDNFRSNKVLITAQYSGKKVTVDPDFVVGETDKSSAFLKKFPIGKLPSYECGDVCLSQTNAISYFVGNEQTRGGDREAEVLQWIGFADNVIYPLACTWVYPTQGILQYNKQSTEKAKTDLQSALGMLNTHLSSRTFLVGERVSQADISLACTMVMLFVNVLDPEFRKPYANVLRWFKTLMNQPQFKAVLCEVKLCDKMAQFDVKKYNEIHGKAEKKQKTPKGKNESGGGGDKKSPKPKKTQEADDEEQLALPPPKKDPWGHLPQTKFDMDDWKRFFSNNDEHAAVKYFWEHFDKENYSLWQGTYQYNEELKLDFMAANLLNGMYQRLEKMRKNAFASMCIFGEDNNLSIDGIWFWKGQELAFKLSDDWQIDYESYEWKKLDPDSEETKKKVEEFFSWSGEFNGRKFNQGKIYK